MVPLLVIGYSLLVNYADTTGLCGGKMFELSPTFDGAMGVLGSGFGVQG